MREASDKFIIEISSNTIFKVIVIAVLLWFLFLVRDIVAMLFFALILYLIMKPAVDWLKARKIPAALSVLIIYLVFILIFAFVILLLIPPMISETEQLTSNFPHYWESFVNRYGDIKSFLDQHGLSDSVREFFNNLTASGLSISRFFSKVSNAFERLISFFVVFVMTFYFLIEEDALRRTTRSVLPEKYQPYMNQLFNKIQTKLGWWVRGQLILSLIIFICVYLALLILQVKYALILAIIAGLLEFIPYLGPLLAGFFAVTLTLLDSPFKAVLVLIIYIVIQQLENHVLVPKVMQKTIGLNPIISIVALLIGARIGGFFGLILAIPVVAAISVFIKDLYDFENLKKGL